MQQLNIHCCLRTDSEYATCGLVLLQIQLLNQKSRYATLDPNSPNAARDKLTIVVSKLDEVCVRAIPKDIPNGEKTQVWILRDKSAEPGDFNLYPVRTQLKNMNRTITQLKKKWGEELISTYKIEQPNAVLFWTCIKKKYLLNIEKCASSNWFRLNDLTLNEFKRGINEMDKLRVYDNVSE